jgi:purine-binding chemotaxis protein CheW
MAQIIENSGFNTGNEDTLKDKYLTFSLAEEDYGIEIRYVIEIIGIQKITKVPNMPSFIKGVINLRGKVIPVMDVRARFSLPPRDYDERTCIVVVNIEGEAMGLVVDHVNEVADIPGAQVEPPPASSHSMAGRYISGIGKMEEEVKILLDVERLTSQG